MVVGIQPNLPELATAANGAATPAGKTTDAAAAVKTPVQIINRLEIKPATVAPGEPSNINVSYTATGKGPVVFRFSIHSGDQTLFESEPENLDVGNGAPMFINKRTTTSRPGTDTIRVQLSLNDVNVQREAVLTVTSASHLFSIRAGPESASDRNTRHRMISNTPWEFRGQA